MIAIVDYGVGNLFSLRCSLEYIGATCCITDRPDEIAAADRLVLPGVGAFGDAADALRQRKLDEHVIRFAEAGRPLLGICLGMQLLYEYSEEFGEHRGLGLIPGRIVSLSQELEGSDLKVPQMGWNDLVYQKESSLLQYIQQGEYVYYVHSFYAPVSQHTVAYSQYGTAGVTGLVQHGNVYGTQFHPEKSGRVGLEILRAFCE